MGTVEIPVRVMRHVLNQLERTRKRWRIRVKFSLACRNELDAARSRRRVRELDVLIDQLREVLVG